MKKVFVGLSGGVDSAVSAALLKKRGFNVVGVFIKIWSPEWQFCTSREDRLDAMRVAAHLEIPFREIDLTQEYKKEVVDYMISEYKAGRTPNPDVFCNKFIKFGAFFDWALKEEADFVATGHYARNVDGKLLAGIDATKDQSYFLWTLKKEQLSKIIFPVGNLEKSEVRRLAKKFNLPNAERKDSQGLCFVGPVDVKDFLAEYLPQKEGNVLDENGNIIGRHKGAFFFTLGERLGFEITGKSPNEETYFVIAKNIEKNTLTVAHKSAKGGLSVEKEEYQIGNMNWINARPEDGKSYKARVRHLGELLECKISGEKITFQKAIVIDQGQSVAIYDEDTCIGGGIVA